MKYNNDELTRLLVAQEDIDMGKIIKHIEEELIESTPSYFVDYKAFSKKGKDIIAKAEDYLENNEDIDLDIKLSFGTNFLLSDAPDAIAHNFIKFVDIPEKSKPGHGTASDPMRFSARGMSDVTSIGIDHICGVPKSGVFNGINLKRDDFYPLGARISSLTSNSIKLVGFKVAKEEKDDYGFRSAYSEKHTSALHDGNFHSYRDITVKETEPRKVTSKSEALDLMKELQKKYEFGMDVVRETRSLTNVVSGIVKGIIRKGLNILSLGMTKLVAEAPAVIPLAGLWTRLTDPIMHNTHFKEIYHAQEELYKIITKR